LFKVLDDANTSAWPSLLASASIIFHASSRVRIPPAAFTPKSFPAVILMSFKKFRTTWMLFEFRSVYEGHLNVPPVYELTVSGSQTRVYLIYVHLRIAGPIILPQLEDEIIPYDF
jgi:hypothetical protein